MNTININELDINPKITESREFSSENIADLVDEVTKYLEEKFPGIYNPFTTRRFIFNNARSEDGTTSEQRSEAESQIKMQEYIDKKQDSNDKIEEIYQTKYKPQLEALKIEDKDNLDKHSDMFAKKREVIREGEDVERLLKELEKEERLAFDELLWSYNKKEEVINNNFAKERAELIEATDL